ncbi:MAG: hypothetical protein JWM14_3416 [Chitinophagaceae bacterium]|nr:hypothetical protein [Chitinophagaceae bacterium]
MRHILYAILTFILLQSCDRMYEYHYKIINKSNKKLKFYCSAESYSTIDTTIILAKDSSELFFISESHGAEGGKGPYDHDKFFDLKKVKIINIDSYKTDIDLTNKKNWKFSKTERIGLYTLTIDSNLVKMK